MPNQRGRGRSGGNAPGNGSTHDPSIISTADNDRALAEKDAPPNTSGRGKEAPEDDGDVDFVDGEDGADDTPGLPDPRGEPAPLDLTRDSSPLGSGHGDGSSGVRHEVSSITRKLRGLGPSVAIRWQRLKPNDLPDTEMGWTPWETLPASHPTEEDVEERIQRAHGGGAFEVAVRSATDKSLVLGELLRITLHGQWKPTTIEGGEFYRSRYGSEPPQMAPRPAADPSLGPTPEDAKRLDAGAMLMGKAMDMAASSANERARDMTTSKSSEMALLVEVLRGKPALDIGTLLPAFLTYQAAQASVQIERQKLELQRETAAREEARKDRELMIALVQGKNNGAGDPALQAANLAAIEIVKQAASDERGLKMEVLRASLKSILANQGFSEGEQESWGDFFQGMLKDGLRAVPAMIPHLASAIRSRNGRAAAAHANGVPAGYVVDANGIMYPAHLAPAGLARPAVAPAPPRALPRPPPTAAMTAATTSPTGEMPPTGAAQPLPRPPPAATAPAPAAGAPPDGAPPAGDGTDGAGGAAVPPEADPPDVDEAYYAQSDVLRAFGYFVGKPAQLRPKWRGFWELVPGGVTHSIEEAFDRAPAPFREAMEACGIALDKSPNTPISFSAWVGETPLAVAKETAAKLDEALLQDPTALAWVRAMLLDGPWDTDDDDDDDDDQDPSDDWKNGRAP